jgi:hypothetical protein
LISFSWQAGLGRKLGDPKHSLGIIDQLCLMSSLEAWIDRSIHTKLLLINCSEEINTQTDSVYRMAGMQIGTVRKWCFLGVEDISIVD